METKLTKTTEKQKQKFDLCNNKLSTKPVLDMEKMMVNILYLQLTIQEMAVLAKGGKFEVAPKAFASQGYYWESRGSTILGLIQVTADEINMSWREFYDRPNLQNPTYH